MKYCSGPFWNTTLTWNSTHPEVTQCFQDTVLIGIPCLIFWLLTPFWLKSICKQNRAQFPGPKKRVFTILSKILGKILCNPQNNLLRNSMKTLYFQGTTILLLNVIMTLYNRIQDFNTIHPGDFLGLVVLSVTYCLTVFLVILERRQNIHSSIVLFYFWIVHFVLSIPQFIKDCHFLNDHQDDASHIFSTICGSPLILCQLMIHSISDHSAQGGEDLPPEYSASHLSRLTWTWMNGLIHEGYKHPLVQSELPKIPDLVDVSQVRPFF